MNIKKSANKTTPLLNDLKNKLLEGNADFVQTEITEYLSKMKIDLHSKIDNSNANYFKLLSVAYKEQGNFIHAEEATQRLLQYYLSKGQKENCADCYLNLAVVYRHISSYNESLKNLTEASKLYEEIGNDKKIAKCEQTLALIYYFLEYYEEAMVRIKNAQKIYEEAKIKCKGDVFKEKYIQLGLISCQHLQGIIKFDGNEKTGALEDLLKAKEDAEKINKERLLGYIYQDLGRFYLTSNPVNDDEARRYLDMSEKIRNKLKDNKGIAICLLYLGMLESKLAKWEHAIIFYKDAIKKAEEFKALDIRIKAYLMMFEAYSFLENHSSAINAIKNYEILKQRESEKKQTNRVQLEKLLPLNDKIKKLNAELDKAKEVVNLTAEVLDLLVPQNVKKINNNPVNANVLKSFNSNRKSLTGSKYENKIPAVVNCLKDVKSVLSEKRKIEILLWKKENENLLDALFDKLKNKKMIADCGIATFKKIMFSENNDSDEYINWQKSNKHFAFLFRYLGEHNLLESDFYHKKFKIIRSKFKKEDADFTNALNSVFTEVMHFKEAKSDNDKITSEINKEMKELVEEIINHNGN